MKQISIFAEENRLQKLSEPGDCLERLNVVDLTDEQKENNRRKSKVRCCIEHIFGFMTVSMHGLTVRSIGIERAAFNIGLTNLTYNLCRYAFLKRKEAAVG